jgi:tRNA pseudouridine55 synthase
MSEKIQFRRLDGILLLDKPQGLSSNNALQVVRRLLRAEKGGHTGSLDPLATGLLPLCFGEATKIAGLLLGSAKAYQAGITLGVTTDTDDAEGQVLRTRAVPPISAAQLEQALAAFIGTIDQRAPIYSALKQGGEPLYLKARRGEEIQAPVRQVQVHDIQILEHNGAQLRLQVTCGSGTYIRSIARDLGEALGCGAHITALRRLWVSPFDTPRMFSLEELQLLLSEGGESALVDCLLPLGRGLANFPRIEVDDAQVARLNMGQRLHNPDWAAAAQAGLFDRRGRAVGLGQVDGAGVLSPQRIFNP